jgi:hypothetical protein
LDGVFHAHRLSPGPKPAKVFSGRTR